MNTFQKTTIRGLLHDFPILSFLFILLIWGPFLLLRNVILPQSANLNHFLLGFKQWTKKSNFRKLDPTIAHI